MENTNWLKQADKPLFPDLLWSRPENKTQAGKLLIVGGSSHGFSTPAGAFSAAEKAGIGSARVVLPDSLQKTLGKTFPEADFAPSTPSGSFSRLALSQIIEDVKWADGVLLSGDFGKNSETAVLLESFLAKYTGLVTLAGDSIDYFLNSPDSILARKNTTLVSEFSQLQALAKKNRPNPPFTHSLSLYELVKALAEWSKEIPVSFITAHEGSIVVASDGRVSTTPVKSANFSELAAYISVWWLQNPSNVLEVLTVAVWEYQKS